MSEQPLPGGSRRMAQAAPLRPAASLLEIHSGAMLVSGASLGAVGLASDLIQFVWWPAQAPFSFEVDALAARLQAAAPHRAWTPWRVRRYRAWAMTFLHDLGNDQWVPLADYYRLTRPECPRPLTAARRSQ